MPICPDQLQSLPSQVKVTGALDCLKSRQSLILSDSHKSVFVFSVAWKIISSCSTRYGCPTPWFASLISRTAWTESSTGLWGWKKPRPVEEPDPKKVNLLWSQFFFSWSSKFIETFYWTYLFDLVWMIKDILAEQKCESMWEKGSRLWIWKLGCCNQVSKPVQSRFLQVWGIRRYVLVQYSKSDFRYITPT